MLVQGAHVYVIWENRGGPTFVFGVRAYTLLYKCVSVRTHAHAQTPRLGEDRHVIETELTPVRAVRKCRYKCVLYARERDMVVFIIMTAKMSFRIFIYFF